MILNQNKLHLCVNLKSKSEKSNLDAFWSKWTMWPSQISQKIDHIGHITRIVIKSFINKSRIGTSLRLLEIIFKQINTQ